MSPARSAHPPVSTRHAFALAFDLAVRRDPWHSLVVPLLLRSPWILALGLLPPLAQTDRPGQVLLLTCVALTADFVLLLVIGAMLRFRAQSVFNTAPGTRPAPVDACYTRGLRRVPWLLVTEVARNVALVFATFFFVLPAFYLGFRLALATEAVVLSEPHTSGAFGRSFHLTQGRLERWLEMVVASVLLIVGVLFLVALLSLAVPRFPLNGWVSATRLLITALTPIIQYAWTFFYLRLLEVEAGWPGIEVGPAYAAAPTGATASPQGAEPVPARGASPGPPAGEEGQFTPVA
jgi:hypothetical protein